MLLTRLCFVLAALVWAALPLRAATRILFVGLDTASSFELRMWVPFGAVSDVAPGTAHLMEHLKFKSSQEQGLQHIQGIPGAGENAETSYNYTRFDVGVTSGNLKEALLALRSVSEPLSITAQQLATEKIIVKQELLQRTTSDPDGPKLLSALLELYQGSELAQRPSGTEETINAITMEDVLAFDKAHYAEADKFLIIAGPPLSVIIQKKIGDLFDHPVTGSIHVDNNRQAKRDDANLVPLAPFLKSPVFNDLKPERIVHVFSSSHVKSTKLFLTKLVPGPTPWQAAVAGRLLQEVVRSRLPEGLRDHVADDAGLVQDFGLDIAPLASGVWQFNFSASLTQGTDPDQVVKVVEDYLATLSQGGISTASLERLKRRHFLLDEWENADQRLANLGSEAATFGYANAVNGREDVKAVTAADVERVLKLLVAPGRIGISILKPEAGP